MLLLSTLIAFIFISFLIYKYLIYPAFISPLSRIPNIHPTSPFTFYWLDTKKQQNTTGVSDLLAAHRKHGSVIRLSPNELSFQSLDAIRQIYSNFEKTRWYEEEFRYFGTTSMLSLIRNREHSERKRLTSHVFSKSHVLNSKDFMTLSRCLLHDRLFPVLEDAARSGRGLDAYSFNTALSMDFTTGFLFGTAMGTDLTREIDVREEILSDFRTAFKGLPGKEKAKAKCEAYVLAMCEAAENPKATSDTTKALSLPPTAPLVYSALISGLAKSSSATVVPHRITAAAEMLDMIIAAIDTSKVFMSYLQWELSQRPDLTAALRRELLSLSPPIRYDPNSQEPATLPDLKTLDSLPLLEAIMKEILRLYAPSPPLFPRVTPRGGATIDGYFIPGGVSVACSAYVLHRNEAVFPDSERFRPERWLSGEKNDGRIWSEQERWLWAFGSGARICIGKHYAEIMLKLCVAAMYTNYNTSIVRAGDMQPEEAFIASPRGEELILNLHSVTGDS